MVTDPPSDSVVDAAVAIVRRKLEAAEKNSEIERLIAKMEVRNSDSDT